MTRDQIARALVDHCRNGTEREGLDTLYDANAVSVEAVANPQTGSAETVGLAAIHGKHEWWAANFEVHGGEVDGPFPHGDNRFAVMFKMDATEKASGTRFTMTEVGVYTVKDGKIVREEFFYASGG